MFCHSHSFSLDQFKINKAEKYIYLGDIAASYEIIDIHVLKKTISFQNLIKFGYTDFCI